MTCGMSSMGDIRLVEACSSVKNQSPKSMIEVYPNPSNHS